MGVDKAMLPIGGIPMAARVAAALREAGATEVFLIGGDPGGRSSLGLTRVADGIDDAGPLAGILAALDASTDEVVVVTACDMPWIEPVHVVTVLDALADKEVAVSAAAGRRQPLHAAWHRRGLPKIRRAFKEGERAPARLIERLAHVVVELGAGPWADDVDTPGDVRTRD
jgi:molybdopterin-guanine dinucleotide biosynthesis protein A